LANRSFRELIGLPPAPSSNGASVVAAKTAATVHNPPPPSSASPPSLLRKAVSFIGNERTIVRLLGGYPADYDPADGRDLRGVPAYTYAALAYICIRYRATKIREAPLMVVNEGKAGEQWIPDHELNGILAEPNPDYDMGRLLEAIETFLCLTGACLLVKGRDGMGRVRTLYPLGKDEFEVVRDPTRARLYGGFKLYGKSQTIKPEDAIFVSYFSPADPLGATAPLDAALSHLNISQALAYRVKAHVKNAMTPGAIYVADKEWRADDEQFERLRTELASMFNGANSGRPSIAEGGGKIERGWSLKDLALGEAWKEAEATISACFAVPASLVGMLVGLENSPWSHLETAKRSFYDETILPEWNMIEGAFTRSLLREVDDNPKHLVRFDTSRVRALQKDLVAQAALATAAAAFTTVNERRAMIGLDRSTEDGADDIPELNTPAPVAPTAPIVGDTTAGNAGNGKARRRLLSSAAKSKFNLRFAVSKALADQYAERLELSARTALDHDKKSIAAIAERELRKGKAARGDNGTKETAPDKISRDDSRRVMTAIEAYLAEEAADNWAKLTTPVFVRASEDALLATVVPDTGVDVQLLRPHLDSYIRREAAFLITNVSDTTKDKVRDALSVSLEEGEGIGGTVKRIRESTAFSRERATLIGRTETTRVLNGAPLESLTQYGATTDQRFTKSWVATMDDRVRDEHAAMNGETVAVDADFSNGLQAPGEPNCRCGLTYGVEGVPD
jgi:HK97 family phage portal protein